MRCLGRLLGLLLAFLFVCALPCSLWTFNTQRIALDGNTYKKVFTDRDFYNELEPRVLPALLKGLQEENPVTTKVSFLDVINHLNAHEWKIIAPTLVPPGWVERTVESNLDSFLTWVDGNGDLVLIFQTDQIKSWLSGPPGEAAVPQIVQSMPACTPEQEQQFKQFVDEITGVEFPYCRPGNTDLAQKLTDLLNTARLDAAQQIPQELNVVQEMQKALSEVAANPEDKKKAEKAYSDAELNRFRSGVQLYKKLLPLSLMIPAALLSLIVIFAIRSSKSFFRWMGWSLIVGSLFTLFPLFLLPFMAHDLSFSSELEGGFATGGALISEVVGSRMIRLLVGAFTWPILIQSAILIGVGFLFSVLSVLLRDPDVRDEDVHVSYLVPSYQTPVSTVSTEAATRLDNTPSAQRTPPPENRSGNS